MATVRNILHATAEFIALTAFGSAVMTWAIICGAR